MAFQLGECLLRNRLNAVNMSQSEFARRMECTPQYVSALVKGKETMSLEFAINASFVLGCKENEFYKLIPVRSRKG